MSVTTIYMTHDQTEARTLGDRVAVLRGGVLQRVDTLKVLYNRPINAFAGSPSMSLFKAQLVGRALRTRLLHPAAGERLR